MEPQREDAFVAEETRRNVRGALRELGSMDREVLILHYIKEMPLCEMQALLEAPEGTIKRRLHVARKRLHKVVDSRRVA